MVTLNDRQVGRGARVYVADAVERPDPCPAPALQKHLRLAEHAREEEEKVRPRDAAGRRLRREGGQQQAAGGSSRGRRRAAAAAAADLPAAAPICCSCSCWTCSIV